MLEVVLFPGKGMSLKRYKPYFPTLKFVDNSKIVLCHSLGIFKAIEYCKQHNIKFIVCIDGSYIDAVDVENIDIVTFRQDTRKNLGDEDKYKEIIYYSLPIDIAHYPYMNKKIREQILEKLIVNQELCVTIQEANKNLLLPSSVNPV